MELSQTQLYQVAEKVFPGDWVLLGTRLGFEYNQIRQMQAEYTGKIRDGIFYMLQTWLEMHPNFTKPDARQFLADQFKRMKNIDLAYSIINTEVGFVEPHNVIVDGLSRHFVYDVRSFQRERELSFNLKMASQEGPVPLSKIMDTLKQPGEFANKLSTCMHVLGLRLTRMGLEDCPGSTIKFTVAAMNEDGVRELSKRLRSNPNLFEKDIKKVVCKSLGMDDSKIEIKTTYSEKEFGEVIQSFQDEVLSSSSEVPPRVNGLELACLAQELDASVLTSLGLNLGETEAEMSDLQSQGSYSCRSAFETMLFRWKAKQHPCGEDRHSLALVLESVGAELLAGKLRRGELRETELEEQRRTYLQRQSATADLKTLRNWILPKPPKIPTHQATAATDLHGGASGATFAQHQHSYVNTVSSQDTGRPLSLEAGNGDYATVIFRTETPPVPPIHVSPEAEPLYDTIREEPSVAVSGPEDEHTYMNDNLLGAGPLQRDPVRRTSNKRQGTSAIPVIHNIDFSVLEGMWDKLLLYNVTERDTEYTAGLIRLAQALDKINHTDIADTVWTALIKDDLKNDYIHRFVTGSINLLPRVITNKQHFEIDQYTSIEDVLHRTKTLEYPGRIFIEADKPEDRELVAEKLGYDWAMEKNPESPFGNIDLLYVLRVKDITPGTTVGGALASQCICREFKLNPNRVEDYFKNTMAEFVIVLKGNDDDFRRLLSASPSASHYVSSNGFKELIMGHYLPNCIVIMTVGPQGPTKSFAHYLFKSATSDC